MADAPAKGANEKTGQADARNLRITVRFNKVSSVHTIFLFFPNGRRVNAWTMPEGSHLTQL